MKTKIVATLLFVSSSAASAFDIAAYCLEVSQAVGKSVV